MNNDTKSIGFIGFVICENCGLEPYSKDCIGLRNNTGLTIIEDDTQNPSRSMGCGLKAKD